MRLIVILLLTLSTNAWSQRKLSADSFRINVRPVLNGILSDFYQMISLFPHFPKELVTLAKSLDSLTVEKEVLKEICPRQLNSKCLSTIKDLRSKLARIQSSAWQLSAEHQMTETLYLNALSGIRITSEFNTTLEELKGELDNTSYLLVANIPHKRETYAILKKIDELSTNLSLALVEFIPFTYREDFRHFYFNFVHPLQQHISKNSNYEFINQNINSLNFALNLLNMNLTKRKKTPDGMKPYLTVIHNRWNSLLRYYF